MNNKGIGSIFCLIAAIFMAARYMAAAIFMSNVSSLDAGLFASGLEYIGPELKIRIDHCISCRYRISWSRHLSGYKGKKK